MEGKVTLKVSLNSNEFTNFSYLGGSDKIPFNDVWVFNLSSKHWSEIKVKNEAIFEGRMCQSASLHENRIYVYGGMKNADVTFDNLVILCLDGKTDDLEEGN